MSLRVATRPLRLTAFWLGVCLLPAATSVLGGCTRSDTVDVTGRVVEDVVTVQAPAVPVPSPDLEAGFGNAGSAALGTGAALRTGSARPATVTALGVTGLGSFVRVASVEVRAGQTVLQGQILAVLDTQLLDANVRAAEASGRVARAQVPVVDAALRELETARGDIASTRATVRSTMDDLRATRARLLDQLAVLRATLKRIESLPAGGIPGGSMPGGRLPTALPPGVIPTSTPGGGLPAGGAMPALPPGAPPDPAKLRAGIAKLESAIAKIDAGLAKADAGLAKLSTASAKIADGRQQLRHVRALARIAADASALGVDLARYQRSLAEVRSPAAGTVVSVVSAGDVIAPGATVAEIRRLGRARVSGWLAPEDFPSVVVGDVAYVSADWMRQPVRGRVTRIASRADYPPTSSATKKVHLTRAVPVEVTVIAGQTAMPPGTPVDISILPDSKR